MGLKIVFMGTPDFAVTTLEALVKAEHEIVGVVTATDKPAGRGKKPRTSSVKNYAEKEGLPLFQPESLKEPGFIEALTQLKADLFIVVAFRMLPEVIWKIPPKGTFNLHASLLPNYRGAAPINWAIINQEEQSGVTTFFIDDKIDTGAILLQNTVKIEARETAGTLHDKLATLGSKLVIATLTAIEKGIEPKTQQTNGGEKHAPKLNKNNTRINWEQPLLDIDAQIRGLSPYPVAWTEVVSEADPYTMKIISAHPVLEKHHFKKGSLLTDKKTLRVALDEGFLVLDEVQLPNKRRMAAADLLNGHRFSEESQVK